MKKLMLPWLLLIPGGMVEWLSLKLKPRTEYHTKLVELLEVESPDKRPAPSLVGYVADMLATCRATPTLSPFFERHANIGDRAAECW